MRKLNKWEKINMVWGEIANGYFEFTRRYKKQLYENYNIDCGTDYANYIFNIGDIKR